MAISKGSAGVIKIAANGGTTANVGEVRSYSIDEVADTLETTAMGDSVKTYLASLTDSTLTVDALWDSADAQQLIFDVGADIDWEIHPEGTAAGKSYSGGGLVTAKTVSASYDGLVEASFSVQVSGTVTEASN